MYKGNQAVGYEWHFNTLSFAHRINKDSLYCVKSSSAVQTPGRLPLAHI